MSALRELKIVIPVAVTSSMFAFAIAEESFALAPLVWVLSMSGWWLTEFAGLVKGIPRRMIGVCFAAIGVFTFLNVMEDGVVVSLFNTALALLIGVKIWEKREVRDYAQILTLSMFLGIGATLNRNSLGVGVALLILVPTLAYGAMLCQLATAAARASMFDADATAVRVRGLAIVGAIAGFLVSMVVFVLVPRGISPPAGFSAFGRLGATRVTGLNDHVRLGQGGLISESQTVVMTVGLMDADGKRVGGEGQVQYLRACVLDEYRNGLWSRSDGPTLREFRSRNSDPMTLDYLRGAPSVSDVRITQSYEMRSIPSAETPIATLYRPISLQENPFREQVWNGSTTQTRFRIDAKDGSTSRSGTAGPLSYIVTSVLNSSEPPSPSRRGSTVFPSSALGEFAREVLRRAGLESDPNRRPPEDDSFAARAFESALRGSCKYSLDTPAAPLDIDPTEWFVLENKAGHCEYFASALAGMCRSVGIDARVITGYIATQFDADAGVYVVRESNAHAWVEVNTAPNVWRVFDATPPADFARQHGTPDGVFSSLGRLLGDLEDLWSNQVVSFDSRAQTGLLGARGRRMITEDWGMRAREAVGDWTRGGRLDLNFAFNGISIVAIIVPALLILARLLRRTRFAARTIDRRSAKMRTAVLDAFAALGVPRPASDPLETHVESLREVQPAAYAVLARAIDAMNRRVFAEMNVDSNEWGRLLAGVLRYRRSRFRLFRLQRIESLQTKPHSTTRG